MLEVSALYSMGRFMCSDVSFFRFHAYDYARHFVSACISLLGLEGCLEGIEFDGRLGEVDAVRMETCNFYFYHLI